MNEQSTSVVTLCMISFVQAYCLVGVFPYAAYMTIFLWNREIPDGMVDVAMPTIHDTQSNGRHLRLFRNFDKRHCNTAINAEQVGPYAALLTTSFMIGRTCTAHFWGRLADCYGRRFVLLASLIGSGLACLWFGMTNSYGGMFGAVMARGVLGAWNSIVGVTKTLATELAYFEFAENGMFKEFAEENIATNDSTDESTEENLLKHFVCSNDQGPRSDLDAVSGLGEGDKNIDDVQAKQQEKQQHMETRIVGLVVGMRAWGYLIAPAIAGFLADPLEIRIHGIDAETNTVNGNIFHRLLKWYPYLLPNLLGLILCWTTAAAVFVAIPETLNGCREFHHEVTDFWQWLSKFFKSGFDFKTVGNFFISRFWKDVTNDNTPSKCEKNSGCCILSYGHETKTNSHTSFATIESSLFAKAGESVRYGSYEDCQNNFVADRQFEINPIPVTTVSPLDAVSSSNQLTEDFRTRINDSASNSGRDTEICCSEKGNELKQQSLRSIWQRTNTRYHLIVYWLYSFTVICIDEAFPLYCISSKNGLVTKMSESDIGIILSLSGILFAFGQFRFYTSIVDRFGIYGSLGLGCWCGVLPTSFIPFASLFQSSDATLSSPSNEFDHGVGNYNKTYSILYLSLLMGVTKLYQSTFFSSITIATNRTVPKEMRSSMNGFASVGAGAVKAIGPIIAGYWMALCFETEEGNNHYVPMKALMAFTGIGSLGVATSAFLKLLHA